MIFERPVVGATSSKGPGVDVLARYTIEKYQNTATVLFQNVSCHAIQGQIEPVLA